MFKVSTFLLDNPVCVIFLIVYLFLEFYYKVNWFQWISKHQIHWLKNFISDKSALLEWVRIIKIVVNIAGIILIYELCSRYLDFTFLNKNAEYFRFLLFVILIGKPINYLYDICFRDAPVNKEDTKVDKDNHKSKTFGIIERLIIGFLLLFKAFETIGLILAAKALVRENKIKSNDAFAEMYFIGTLFSLIGVLAAWTLCYW